MHTAMRRALDDAWNEIGAIQRRAREAAVRELPRCRRSSCARPRAGPDRKCSIANRSKGRSTDQIPIEVPATNDEHRAALECWLRSYRIDDLFDEAGRPREQTRRCIPGAALQMGRSPHANGGTLTVPLDRPPLDDYAVPVERRGAAAAERTTNLEVRICATSFGATSAAQTSASARPTKRRRTG